MPQSSHAPRTECAALIEDHIGLVGAVLRRVARNFPHHVDREDLWGAGALGLVEAASRFDSSRGVPFANYATARIEGSIIDAARGRDWAPRSLRRRCRDADAAVEALWATDGSKPTDVAVAEHMGSSVAALIRLRAAEPASSLLTLDGHGAADGSPSLTDLADRTTEHQPESDLLRAELSDAICQAMDCLPLGQREVIRRHYLAGETLRDIAADAGVSAARISQVRAEAVAALRGHLRRLYDTEPPVERRSGRVRTGRVA